MVSSKKILVLLPFAFYRPSGSAFNSYFRVKALLEIGSKVDVITYPHGENLKMHSLKIIRIPKNKIFKEHQAGEYKKKIFYDLLIFVSIFKKLFNGNYDVVIAHGTCIFYTIIFKLFFRAKFISNLHGNLEVDLIKWKLSKNKKIAVMAGRLEAFIISRYDAAICIHDSVKALLLKNKIKNTNIYVIHNSFESNGKVDYTAKNDNSFTILYTGTFVEVQNLELIYKAAEILNKDEIKFVVVGGTEDEIAKEQKKIRGFKSRRVEFFPRQTHDALLPFFIESDVVISPRVYGHDTPMKIFDYLSKGKCIIAADRPIHKEILNARNAYLFEPTPEKLAEAVLFLKNNPDIRKKLGENAKFDFDANYSFGMMKEKYRELLSSL